MDAQQKRMLTIRVIGAGNSQETTECTEQFLIGILSAYPYKILGNRISQGIIEVTAEETKAK